MNVSNKEGIFEMLFVVNEQMLEIIKRGSF